MKFDLGMIREHLRKLKWGDGLTPAQMRHQWRGMPQHVYDGLPKDYVFRNEGEVMSYLEHLLHDGFIDRLEDTGEDPKEYRISPTGATQVPRQHGVGSGAGSGYTGGGSVQTGAGREGTTYGDTEEEVRNDRRGRRP
ncbi:MAG: hypothetical protein M1343_09710 [Chloroflexi bacterium]|nr:hypothetical protein [Chloroflexota bacterium]MDA8187681.1 hypothetical protein [Dehalococcoidales bacterium]